MSLVPKKGLDSLWPIMGKKVLVRVDFNVPIKDGVIQNDYRIRSALPTLRKIIDQGGICIVMSHLGRPTGVNISEGSAPHKVLLDTWIREKGKGKTAYFALLSSEDKVSVLEQLPKSKLPAEWGGKIPVDEGNGKTTFFSGLPEDEKTSLLDSWNEVNRRQKSDFDHLRKYHGYEAENTLAPVAERLGELIGKKVVFAPDCLDAMEEVSKLQPGDIMLLENVRFYREENSKKEEDRMKMARILAEYGDYYVCDAFGTAHRDAASITGIPKVLGHGCAGYLMKKEIDYFAKALTNPARPMCAIVGGSKVSDKIKVLNNLVTKVNKLLIGGAMAYVFLKAQGFKIGKSFCETSTSFSDKYGDQQDPEVMARNLMKKAADHGVELLLPVDHVTHTEFKNTDKPNVTDDANVPDDHMALDIGPKTRQLYTKAILGCKTVVWNGPMGVFEKPAYAQGTFDVAKALAECDGLSIIGGGDSASAAEMSGYATQISHVSTGGGASLELLEGKVLPGVAALDDAPESEEQVQNRLLNAISDNITDLKARIRQLEDAARTKRSPSDVIVSAVVNAVVFGLLSIIARKVRLIQ